MQRKEWAERKGRVRPGLDAGNVLGEQNAGDIRESVRVAVMRLVCSEDEPIISYLSPHFSFPIKTLAVLTLSQLGKLEEGLDFSKTPALPPESPSLHH